jgi:hypothetical protein
MGTYQVIKEGDLVMLAYPESFKNEKNRGTGLVVAVRVWESGNVSVRNSGVDVKVLWEDGSIESFDEIELDLLKRVNEVR